MGAVAGICRWCGQDVLRTESSAVSYERLGGVSKKRIYHMGERDCYRAFRLSRISGRTKMARGGERLGEQVALL